MNIKKFVLFALSLSVLNLYPAAEGDHYKMAPAEEAGILTNLTDKPVSVKFFKLHARQRQYNEVGAAHYDLFQGQSISLVAPPLSFNTTVLPVADRATVMVFDGLGFNKKTAKQKAGFMLIVEPKYKWNIKKDAAGDFYIEEQSSYVKKIKKKIEPYQKVDQAEEKEAAAGSITPPGGPEVGPDLSE